MENINQSFELLSSMSPKLKGRQKTVKKAIKILALKKHFRRSSIYDKAPAVNNEDLAIIEASTGTSESSSNFQRNVLKSGENKIIVIDSTDSEDMEVPPIPKSKKLSSELLRNCGNSDAKTDRIQEWLSNIEMNEKRDNITFFSQVSTIYGDEAPKFDPDGNGMAASSTFNEYLTRRFDELFVSDTKNKPNNDLISDDSFSIEINTSLTSKLKERSQNRVNKSGATKHNENSSVCKDSVVLLKKTHDLQRSDDIKNLIIDETLLTSDESFVESSSNKKPEVSPNWTPERTLLIPGEHVTTRRKIGEKNFKSTPLANPQEMESVLDSLYGVKWRQKQDLILSEPKKSLQKKIVAPNTERILKPSNKENTQNKLNLAAIKLNFDKLKIPSAPSWVQRLKGLVDSDSDNNLEDANDKAEGIEKVRTRLNFCEDTPLTKPKNDEHTEKKVNNEVNFDESAKASKDINKKGGRNKNSTKENNPSKENKTQKKNKELQNRNKGKPEIKNDVKEQLTRRENKKPIKSRNDNKKSSKSSSSSNSHSEIEISSDEEYDKEVTRLYEVKRKSMVPLKERKSYSFLESLSGFVPLDKCDVTARIFRRSFKLHRDELKKKLFSLYNEKVFDNAIPSDTELEWNDKLRNTAGLCYCKKITHRDGKVVRKVKIALSSKVLDSADRLRDTLIHEMCHAGTWIVNQISNGHGVYWKNWAFKAMRVFPELPPIKRCHTYQINTKYTYKCTGCGYSFGRHSKSLDTERKRCGHCYGKFELLLNKTYKSGETKSVPVTPRKQATGFSLFVKENYARYKEPSLKHGDVMKILGQKFSELKVKNNV